MMHRQLVMYSLQSVQVINYQLSIINSGILVCLMFDQRISSQHITDDRSQLIVSALHTRIARHTGNVAGWWLVSTLFHETAGEFMITRLQCHVPFAHDKNEGYCRQPKPKPEPYTQSLVVLAVVALRRY